MSGSETLTPFLKEKKDDEQPIVIVDSREATSAPKIVKGLREKGAEIKIAALEKGDYIISDQCAFEHGIAEPFRGHAHRFQELSLLSSA